MIVSTGDGGRQPQHAQHAQHGDQDEREAPACEAAERGRRGHADEVGQGQAQHHRRHRRRPALLAHQGRGHERADTEERAVRQAGQETGDDQQPEGRRRRRERVACREQAHEQQQRRPPAQPDRRGGEQRRAHHDADGVRGDEVARGGDGDGQIGGDVGKQAHHGELGESDGTCAQRQRQDGERHGENLCRRWDGGRLDLVVGAARNQRYACDRIDSMGCPTSLGQLTAVCRPVRLGAAACPRGRCHAGPRRAQVSSSSARRAGSRPGPRPAR